MNPLQEYLSSTPAEKLNTSMVAYVANLTKVAEVAPDIASDVIKEFEKISGIKVVYSNYETNEDLYAKLSSSNSRYDIIVPSDYMIARMINEDMLSKIDTSKLSNYDLIDSKYKNVYFDPNNE